MSRSSARRGQTEPLAALAAVSVLGVALVAYAGAHAGAAPPVTDRDRADPAMRAALDTLHDGAVVDPSRLSALDAPGRVERRVTLSAGDRRWTRGPRPPERADTARRLVSVRVAPGRVRPGRVRVEVWTP